MRSICPSLYAGAKLMTEVRYLRADENLPTQSDWILIEASGPVWVVNSATFSDDNVPSDPIGPFHTRNEALEAAADLARTLGIETVYVRNGD
jgi:hypothetical protein